MQVRTEKGRPKAHGAPLKPATRNRRRTSTFQPLPSTPPQRRRKTSILRSTPIELFFVPKIADRNVRLVFVFKSPPRPGGVIIASDCLGEKRGT